MKAPLHAPCWVDFAGGWLDNATHAIEGAYIVNCAVSCASLGQSTTGWQDAAINKETGLCVWRSGPTPVLDTKVNPDWLKGLMALWYCGHPNNPVSDSFPRNYQHIAEASYKAAGAVRESNLSRLAEAINMAHNQQLEEGMASVPSALRSLAYKYVGSGHGGYVLYLFASLEDRSKFCERQDTMAVEPFLNRSSDAPKR